MINDLMMPTLLSMLTKEKGFNDLSKKTQLLIKMLIIINTLNTVFKIATKCYDLVRDLNSKAQEFS